MTRQPQTESIYCSFYAWVRHRFGYKLIAEFTRILTIAQNIHLR